MYLEGRGRVYYCLDEGLNNGLTKMQEKKSSKEKKILEDSLDLIPSPSSSVKTQIMGQKFYLRE